MAEYFCSNFFCLINTFVTSLCNDVAGFLQEKRMKEEKKNYSRNILDFVF